jgi:hypothetical protein
MRLSVAAAAASCCLLPIAAGFAAAPAAQPASAPAAATSGDAAAKHTKRTACLKNAKARKLVGAEKTTFLKNCMAEP